MPRSSSMGALPLASRTAAPSQVELPVPTRAMKGTSVSDESPSSTLGQSTYRLIDPMARQGICSHRPFGTLYLTACATTIPKGSMRRLFLAVALLSLPAIARADGPADELLYRQILLRGCVTPQNIGCVEGVAYETQSGWFGNVTCPSSNMCMLSTSRLELYDAGANLIWHYGFGNTPTGAPTGTPAFGLARFAIWPDETFSNAQPAVVALGIVTTTPEPASMVLLGSGLVGLLAVRRRRRSDVQPGDDSV